MSTVPVGYQLDSPPASANVPAGYSLDAPPKPAGAPANRAGTSAVSQPNKPDISNQGQPPIQHGKIATAGHVVGGTAQELGETAQTLLSPLSEPERVFPQAYAAVKKFFTSTPPSPGPVQPMEAPPAAGEATTFGAEPPKVTQGAPGETWKGKTLAASENIPIFGDITSEMEKGAHATPIPGKSLGTQTETSGPEMGTAIGRGLTRAALLKTPELGPLSDVAATEKAATVPAEIAGLSTPRLASEAGVAPGFGPVEKLLGGVPVIGEPIQAKKAAQAAFPEQVLSKLAGAPPITSASGETQSFASRFNQAANNARAAADPMYNSLHHIELSPDVSTAAESVLKDREIADVLGRDPKNSLGRIAPEKIDTPMLDQLAEWQHGKGSKWSKLTPEQQQADLNSQVGQAWAQDPRTATELEAVPTPPSFKDAHQALSDIKQYISDYSDPSSKAYDADRARRGWNAYHTLNDSVEASMTPEQLATKKAADRLWYQSYVKDRIGNGLFREISGQPIGESMVPKSGSYNSMINELGRVYKNGKESALEAAYPNVADRQAFKDLGKFLQGTQSAGTQSSRFLIMGMLMGRVSLVTPALARAGAEFLANPEVARTALSYLKAGGRGAKAAAAAAALQNGFQRSLKTQQFQNVAPEPQPNPVPAPIASAASSAGMSDIPAPIASGMTDRSVLPMVQMPDGSRRPLTSSEAFPTPNRSR